MKKYKVFIWVWLGVLLQTCNKDFLEKTSPGSLAADNFFQTEEHAVWGTNAIYEHLRAWEVHVFSFIGMTDMISDDSDKGSTVNDASFLKEIDDFSFDASNIAPATVWSGYYRGIYRANVALQNIPNIEMDEDLKSRLLGECKFLRAYFYFNLVRWFGDLPLITEPLEASEFEQQRVPAADIYALIKQDLGDAINQLPQKSKYPSQELGRATKGAAQGLLAKVHLTLQEFGDAEILLLDIIQSEEYALMADYQKIFTVEGENAEESLFEVQTAAFDQGIVGSQYNEVQGVRGTPNLGWGFNRPSDDLVAAYELGDPRREATILYPGEVLPDGSDIVQDNPNIVNERYNQKAWVPEHAGGNRNGPGNIRLLRYADILLMAAEVLNENNKSDQALVHLNAIRERARGNRNGILPPVSTTNQVDLRERIWQERRVELAMEQQRWFDLLRTGRAADLMQKVGKNFVNGKHELFPIPQTEIDLSAGNIKQNPGY